MTISDYPHRGQVHLANVPFSLKQPALQNTERTGQAGGSSDMGRSFTAEIQFKLRPVLIVQSDALTVQPGYEYVLVAPIYSVREHQKARPEYELLVAQRLPQVFYLDRREQGVTRPSYIALAQLQLLHRTMLRGKRGMVTDEEMLQIEDRLRFCLGL